MYNSLIPRTNIKNALRLLQLRQLKSSFCCTDKLVRTLTQKNDNMELYGTKKSSHYLPNVRMTWSQIRTLCSREKDSTTSSKKREDLYEVGLEHFEEVDVGVSNYSLKSLLYDEQDELMKRLNQCKSHHELMEITASSKESLQLQHLVQCVLLLWTFCRNLENNIAPEILAHKEFGSILDGLYLQVENMSSTELSCCYLYLLKIGLNNADKLMRDLLLQSLKILNKDDSSEILLPVLSRIIVAINTSRDFHTASVCQKFPQHIENHINNCTTAEDARLLSICLFHLHQLTSDELLDLYKAKIHHLIKTGVINKNTVKCILKIIHMLNIPFWSQRNAQTLRELMLILKPSIRKMGEEELKALCKIFQSQLEPAGLIPELKDTAEQLLSKNRSASLLACYILFAKPKKNDSLIALFKKLLATEESWKMMNASTNLFMILRGLKTSDVQICNDYWSGVVRELESKEHEEQQLRFLRHCHQYMNFNNNLGGTYRHMELEQKLSQKAMHMIENDVAGLIPSKFARLAAFVLAYGHTKYGHTKFPNIIVSKILSMANQFSITDCFQMSRGLQIAREMRFRHYNPPPLSSQLAIMENVFAECTQRHLSGSEKLTPIEINAIVRSLNNRKASKRTQVYQQALSKYKDIDCSTLTSRAIREMSYNFTTSNFIVPEVLEAMFHYVEKNHEHIYGDTVEKILTCAYSLGYTPKSFDVFGYAAHILKSKVNILRRLGICDYDTLGIIGPLFPPSNYIYFLNEFHEWSLIFPDFDYMSELSLVQGCLALCYYKATPVELISKMFSINFIQRIEDEIEMCYSKATYPERVLNLVMQLNRTVCLDFPEANIPWFQQNFIEAQLSKKPVKKTRFSEDVQHFLQSVLKSESYFRCNHVTPYGYRIDFVIHFDKDNKPIEAPIETTMLDRITKVAILLLKLDSFCENDITTMRGPESLRMKHLEMMGYKVIHININDWNSKYMNAPNAKSNYLKCLLQISN